MVWISASLALIALLLAAVVASLLGGLRRTRAALAAAENRPAPPPPPRTVESRRERFGLLWFPLLTVRDDEKLIVSVVAGLPHCARCVRALTVSPGPPEEWSCAGCGERRPASTADLQVTDSVIADALAEFSARHPGYRAAPGVGAAKRLKTA